jgi:hypothetical protein
LIIPGQNDGEQGQEGQSAQQQGQAQQVNADVIA